MFSSSACQGHFSFQVSIGLRGNAISVPESTMESGMARKLRVGVLFGGRSGEHEVSLLSAASILKAIDRKKFEVVPIGITKEGRWLAAADATNLLGGDKTAVGRRLRARDPQATPGAKLLHEGIPTLL